MSAQIIPFGAKPEKVRKPKRRNSHKQMEQPAAERPFSTQTLLRHARPLPEWLEERNKKLEEAVTCVIGAKTYKVTFDHGRPDEVFSVVHRTLWGRPNTYYRPITSIPPQRILDLAEAQVKDAGEAIRVPAGAIPASSKEATAGQLVDAYLALDSADRCLLSAVLFGLASLAAPRSPA